MITNTGFIFILTDYLYFIGQSAKFNLIFFCLFSLMEKI